jgi:uncharacterized protein YjbI with pentapeptide repeats
MGARLAMRCCGAIVFLTLLAAPIGARAEEPSQPVPADGKCAVPAREEWKPQEKLVWQQVCVGKEANFNSAAGYGGELDPKSPWGLPDSRVLSSAFLETILLDRQYRGALTRLGVRIIGARFTETINLEEAELGHDLALADSLLEKGANLLRVRSAHTISFDHSKVAGTLNLDGLQVRNLLSDHAEFADVDLRSSHVTDHLTLDGSKVKGGLVMNGIQVGHLAMREGEFANVDLSVANASSQVELTGSTVIGKLDMRRLQVGGELVMHDAKFADVDLGAAQVRGELDLTRSKVTAKLDSGGLQAGDLIMFAAELRDVELSGAHVASQVLLDRSRVAGKLTLNAIDVSNLRMRDAEFIDVDLTAAHVGSVLALTRSKVSGHLNMVALQVGDLLMVEAVLADVDLRGAHVSRLFSLIGSKVSGPLIMSSLRVGSDLLMYGKADFNEIALSNASVGGQLSLAGSKVTGTLDCSSLEVAQDVNMKGAVFGGPANLRAAKIRGDLIVSNGNFQHDVDLTGAEIGGALHLDSAQWSPDVTLRLSDAKVDRIPCLADGWPGKLDVNGFTYRFAGTSDQYKTWFRRADHYEPQAYEQLASVVQNQGKSSLATEIRYSGREAERQEAKDGWRIWLAISNWVIGYGYYPERAICWAFLITLVGACVMQATGEGPRNGMPFGLAYSFDMLLPIIRLRDKHYQIDLQTWGRYYFYVHKILGFAIASFLIAGLSGLTK